MRVGYIQYDVKRDSTENIKQIESKMQKLNADLVALPELCMHGYLFENKKELQMIAEAVPTGESVIAMQNLSEKYGNTIIFGIAEKENNKIYNTAVIVNKGKYVGKYRKIHLSDFEKRLFDRGDENQVFEIDGLKIGVQICFDLWFPEVSREQIRKGADILCVLANFGGETSYHIAKIRAIENLTPLVLCNRVGSEKTSEMDADFLGKSSVIDRDGTRIITASAGIEDAGACKININKSRANVICANFDEEIALHY